ncbi:F-box/kelch-repeat protein SKIP30 [Linum grandiflorum]
MSELIEGLPDSVAIRCLARVPFYQFPKLESVSRSWQAAIRGSELYKARQEVGSTEELLCVCAFDPENIWQLYDPLRELWITLPILPSKVRNLAQFGAVSVSGKLYVLGGNSDAVDLLTGDQDGSFATNEVWAYDPILRQWARRAPMLRGLSTVQVLDSVASGWTVEDYGWVQGPMAVVESDVYVMSHGLIVKQEGAVKKVVVSASEFRKRIGVGMTELRGEIYVLGGLIGPDQWNWGVQPLSDVDVLTVGGERPTWHRAAPMTRCRGTILGCTQLRI